MATSSQAYIQEGSTTIPEGSTLQAIGSGSGGRPRKGDDIVCAPSKGGGARKRQHSPASYVEHNGYLRAAKTELEDAGESSEGCAESVSKLREQLQDLTGVDIMLDEHTFKSTYQIIKEISEVWDRLSDATQANVTGLIAGKRNANVVQALMTNFQDAENAMQTAMNSSGSAFMENEKYLDSIAGKVDVLKGQFQALSNGIIGSDGVKFFVDLATNILKVANALEKVHLLLPAITAISFTTIGRGLVRDVSQLTSSVMSLAGSGRTAAEVASLLENRMLGLSASQKQLLVDHLQMLANNNQLDQSYVNQIRDTLGLAAAEDTLSSANQRVSMSFKAMWAAMPVIGKIGLIISAITSIVSLVVPAISRAKEEAIEASEEIVKSLGDARDEYEDNISRINGVKDRYAELAKGVGSHGENVSLTASEYDEFIGLLNQLIDISPNIKNAYDAQSEAVANYANAVSAATAEQKKSLNEQMHTYLANGDALFSGQAKKYADIEVEIQKAGSTLANAIVGDRNRWVLADYSEDIFKALQAIGGGEEYASNIERLMSAGSDIEHASLTALASSYEDLRLLSEKQDAFENYLRSTGKYSDEQLTQMSLTIHNLSGQFSKLDKVESNQVDYLMEWAKTQDYYYQIPTNALDEFRAALFDVNDAYATVGKNITNTDIFGAKFVEALNSDGAKNIINLAKALHDGEGDVNKELSTFNSAVEAYVNTIEDPIIQTFAAMYFSSLSNGARTAAESIEDTVESVTGLKEAIDQLKSGEEILSKAKTEMREDDGVSRDTISSVQSAIESAHKDKDLPEYLKQDKVTDYFYLENGLIKMNTDLWEKRNRAIADHDIAVIKAEIAELEDERGELQRGAEFFDPKNIQEVDERLKELYVKLALYESATTDDPLKLDTLMSDLSGVESKASGLISALNELAAGTMQDWDELVKKYPDLMNVEGLFDITTASGMSSAIETLLDKYQDQFDKVIDDQIEKLEERRKAEEATAEEKAAIDITIKNLEIMKRLGIEVGNVTDKYNAAKTGIDNVVSALKDSSSELGINADQVKQLTARYGELEGFNAEKLFENTAMGIHLNAEELAKLESAYQKQSHAQRISDLEDLTGQYEALTEQMMAAGDVEKYKELFAERSGIAQRIKDLNMLEIQYGAIISKYNAWKQAQSAGEEGDMFDDIQGSLKDINKLYEKGLVGTNKFRAAVGLMTNMDVSNLSSDDLVKIYKEGYPVMKKYFTEGSTGLERFLKDINKITIDGEQIGKTWAYLNENGDWVINIDDYAKAADELGISTEAFEILLRKLKDYGFDIDLTGMGDGLDKYVTNVDDAIAEVKKKMAELQENPSGMTPREIAAQQKQLQETLEILESMNGESELDLDSMTIDEAKEKIKELASLIATLTQNGIQIPITLTGQYDLLAQLLGLESEHLKPDTSGMFDKMPKVFDKVKDWVDAWAKEVWDGEFRFAEMPTVADEPLQFDEMPVVIDEPLHADEASVVVDKPLQFDEMPVVIDEPLPVEIIPEFSGDYGAGDLKDLGIIDEAELDAFSAKLQELRNIVNTALQSKEAAGNSLIDFFGQGGLVDLLSRLVIPADWLTKAGYGEDLGDIATVFSSSYNIGENGEIGVVLTPILPNGEPIDSENFFAALDNLIVGSEGKVELPEGSWGFDLSDTLLSQIDLSGIPEALRDKYMEAFGYALHLVQEYYYDDQEPIEAPIQVEPKPEVVSDYDGLDKGAWSEDWNEDELWPETKEVNVPVEVTPEPELSPESERAPEDAWMDSWDEIWDETEDISIPVEVTPEPELSPESERPPEDSWMDEWDTLWKETDPKIYPVEVEPEPISGGTNVQEKVFDAWGLKNPMELQFVPGTVAPTPVAGLTSGDVDTAANAGLQLGNAAKEAGVASDAVKALTDSYFQLYAAMDQVNRTDPADSAGVEAATDKVTEAAKSYWQAFNDVLTKMEETGNAPEIKFGADVTDVLSKIATLTIPEADVVFNPDTKAVEAYAPADKEAKVKFYADFARVITAVVPTLKGKIEYSYTTVGEKPTLATGTAKAEGTAYRGGNGALKKDVFALSGELGPELVVRDGRYFTVGDNGAEFFPFKSGDIIFNASQTRELLKTGRVKSRGGRGKLIGDGSAYAEGTAFAYSVSGKGAFRDKSGSGKSKKSSGSKGGGGNSKSSSSNDDGLFDWIEVAIDRIERKIEDFARVAESAFKTTAQRLKALGSKTSGEIATVTKEIDLQNQAAARYLKQAEKTSLKESTKKLIREGKIDITKYSDSQLERIQEYQKWY